MPRLIALLILCAAVALPANPDECSCDPSDARSMEPRRCSLCREAEKQPANQWLFFLKDNSPFKPNRWLMLPRSHAQDGRMPLSKFTRKERIAFWNAAILRARALWGDQWGLAMNGDEVRTQCHAHIHIGRLLKGVEFGNPVLVSGPSAIPVPKDGSGMWIHPYGKKLHVHLGEQRAETVLLR